MATDIKTQFTGAVSPKVSGGAGSFSGSQNDGVDGAASLTSINGSPIVNFDDSSARGIPREEQLPSQFETSIKKTGI